MESQAQSPVESPAGSPAGTLAPAPGHIDTPEVCGTVAPRSAAALYHLDLRVGATGSDRPVLRVHDVRNDLSTVTHVRQCIWEANVPESLLRAPPTRLQAAYSAYRALVPEGAQSLPNRAHAGLWITPPHGPDVLLADAVKAMSIEKYVTVCDRCD